MKCRYLSEQKYFEGYNSEGQPIFTPKPAGFEIEHEDAWKICLPGYGNSTPMAEPADEECAARVKHWKETDGVAGRKVLAFMAATMTPDYPNRDHVLWLCAQHAITKEEMNEAVAERKAIDSQATSTIS